MIHRPNYEDVQRYLVYVRETMQRDEETVQNHRATLYVLLQWADATPLPDCKNKRPLFPAYVTAKRHENGKPLSLAYMDRILKNARAFFNWARKEYSARYKVPPTWVDSLRLPRAASDKREVKTVDPWELADVLKIAALQVDSVQLKRDQAALAFLYLSGMRSSAFVTLPISCVNIQARQVEQSPSKGVKTKNRKAAITTLLPIPELLRVVEDWDSYVRDRLPSNLPWYALGDYDAALSEYVLLKRAGTVEGMRHCLIDGMHKLCDLAGVPYKIPHKIRHGHAVYGIKQAQSLEEFKAVSQNLMHSSISITDGIYGNLTGADMQSTIAKLGQKTSSENGGDDLLENVKNALLSPQVNPTARKQLLMTLIGQLLE